MVRSVLSIALPSTYLNRDEQALDTIMLRHIAHSHSNRTPHRLCERSAEFSSTFGLYPVMYRNVNFRQLQICQWYASRKTFGGENTDV